MPAASSLDVTLNEAASSMPVEVCWPACSVVLGTVEEGTEISLRTMRYAAAVAEPRPSRKSNLLPTST
ncbi:hypothetical protein D9M71_643640 [compost metagenome]